MAIKKLTYGEFESAMWKHNESNGIKNQGKCSLMGVVVFKQESFDKPFTEAQRSYMTYNNQKAFIPNMISNSIFADCLDGTDTGVRLDWYMRDKNKPWEVEYCYIVEPFDVVKTSKETGEQTTIDLYKTLCLTEGREYWKAGTVAEMLMNGEEVFTPFATFKKA